MRLYVVVVKATGEPAVDAQGQVCAFVEYDDAEYCKDFVLPTEPPSKEPKSRGLYEIEERDL